MALYNKEKLVILFALSALLLGSALWQLQPHAAAGSSSPQPGYVYELAGGAPAPGIYRFEGPRTLAQLLAAARVPAANCAQPGRRRGDAGGSK